MHDKIILINIFTNFLNSVISSALLSVYVNRYVKGIIIIIIKRDVQAT